MSCLLQAGKIRLQYNTPALSPSIRESHTSDGTRWHWTPPNDGVPSQPYTHPGSHQTRLYNNPSTILLPRTHQLRNPLPAPHNPSFRIRIPSHHLNPKPTTRLPPPQHRHHDPNTRARQAIGEFEP